MFLIGHNLLSNESNWLLHSLLAQAGINSEEITITNLSAGYDFAQHNRADAKCGIAESKDLVRRLRPNLIVAFGNEASYAFTSNWPSKTGDVWGAYGIQQRRGYLWLDGTAAEASSATKVLTTLHPADCLVRRDPSGVNAMLLMKDLERAKNEAKTRKLRRINYSITVVDNNSVDSISSNLRMARNLACDIECFDSQTTACIGFAPNNHEAFIFPPQHFEAAHKLLLQKNISKIFANGQFDLYQLLSRNGVRTAGSIHDIFVQWHCLWPEIASQKDSRNKKQGTSKRTHKSLSFLQSIYGDSPEYWKDYNFANDYEMYELNGKDCCITFDLWEKMNHEIEQTKVHKIYEHERRMVWPVVDIQHRGLRVDMELRKTTIKALTENETKLSEGLTQLIEPLLQERRESIERPGLFWKLVSCKCCGNGKKKREQCWSCAGFDKAPSKKDLINIKPGNANSDINLVIDFAIATKVQLEKALLQPCQVCNAAGQWETFHYNPGSNDQTKEILYNVLRLPKRMKKGKLSSDEEVLKSLLGGLG